MNTMQLFCHDGKTNYSKYKALNLIQDRTGGLEKKELPSFYAMPSALPTVAYYM